MKDCEPLKIICIALCVLAVIGCILVCDTFDKKMELEKYKLKMVMEYGYINSVEVK